MLIVGLGNPGPMYAQTRHNIGFMVIDELVRKTHATPISKASFEGELFKFKDHYLLKPMTFMNLSGRSVSAVKNFYKIDDVLVIHDDLDLPFGALRFKRGGGHGGHNGLKSIDSAISKEYARVRMGIAKPPYKGEVVNYVLSAFNEAEKEHLDKWIKAAADAVMKLDTISLEDVSSQYSIKQI
ncbi:aminoacyl-tRNA hydrolase [Sulfurimonas sp. HSL-1716]|uniref:aminoacyl-tRNA hydrolase n=1 Tax=Hydrocurvibacter sulfurireducens TaxID=3131937 RepID=UPI0031F73A7B